MLSLSVALCWALGPALADKGMIPTNPDAKIYEPRQTALIAFNGTEELLVLSTDVRASDETDVLTVLALPSEPKVTQGDFGTIDRAVEIINRHQPPEPEQQGKEDESSEPRKDKSGSQPAGLVTWHERTGAHDVSVTKVLDARRFNTWAADFLHKRGSSATVPAWLKTRIDEYMKEGFHWFVFDTLRLSTHTQSVQPLRYRFKTNSLFYPLKMTRVDGNSTAKLIVISSEEIRKVDWLGSATIRYEGKTINLKRAEVKYIDPEMDSIIAGNEYKAGTLGFWRVSSDPYRGFDRDLYAHFGAEPGNLASPKRVSQVPPHVVSPEEAISYN